MTYRPFYGNNDPVATNHDTLTAPAELPTGAIHQIPSARLNKPLGRPDTVSVGVIVWLASELMFFAALFAAYFWIRNITNDAAAAAGVPSLWETNSAHLDLTFASINTAILVLSSVTCQLAANAAEANRVTGSWLNPTKRGLREGFIVTSEDMERLAALRGHLQAVAPPGPVAAPGPVAPLPPRGPR